MYKLFCKMLSLALLLSFITCIDAGCSSDENAIKEADIITPTKPTTLTIYFDSDSLPAGYEEVIEEFEKRTAKNLNIKLVFKKCRNGTEMVDFEKLINSGEPCDIIFTSFLFRDLAEKDLLYDIKELFPQYAPNLYSLYQDEDLAQVTYQDKLLAIPSNNPSSMRYCAIVRKDILEKFNIASISSFDDLERLFELIKKEEPDLSPTHDCNTIMFIEQGGYVHFDDFLVYKWDDPDMQLMPWEQTQEFADAVKTLKRWDEKGYTRESGPYAVYIATLGYTGFFTYIGEGYDWAIFPLGNISFAQRLPILENNLRLNSSVAVFNKNSPNIKQALQFMEWMNSSDENYNLLCYGIENRDYKLADGKIELMMNKAKGYNAYYSFPFANIKYLKELVGSPDWYKEFYLDFVNGSRYAPHTGFILSAKYKNALSPRVVENAVPQRQELFYSCIKTGKIYDRSRAYLHVKNLDINKFIEEQEKTNLKEIVKKIQQQLDEWRSKGN